MTLYRMDVIDEEKQVHATSVAKDGVNFDYSSLGLGKVFIIVIKRDMELQWADMFKDNIRSTLRKSLKDDEIEVILIAGIDPDDIKFFRITPIDLTPPKPKSLHSRKIRRRAKFDSTNSKKEDDQILQKDEKEEKVQKEETSRGDEESETWWPWTV